MADGMSFDRYIDNPMGGSVLTNRNIYKQFYKSKFDAILVREQGRIKFTIYKTDDAYDSYYIHMKIPSEVIENFYYDVVVQLYTTDNSKKNNANLRNYGARFYSNDPAFVYTFAYTFNKRDLFIADLIPKMSKPAIKNKAEVKNPNNQVSYVKSLFFAYLTMEKYGLFSRPMLNQHAIKYVKRTLLSNVEPADNKIKARQKAEDDKRAEAKKRKEAERKALLQKSRTAALVPSKGVSSRSKVTKTVNAVKSTKVSKSTRISRSTNKK